MSRKADTIPADYFEDKYRSDIDPWQFRTSDYERGKFRATIDALDKARFAHALEIGCSIGVLTARLAERCDAITAIDASATAIASARQASVTNATFVVGMLPQDFPTGTFDLIVLSEVLYYFDAADLAHVAALCLSALRPGGEIVVCHWLGETDYPLTGEIAHELFAKAVITKLPVRVLLAHDVYRLERFRRSDREPQLPQHEIGDGNLTG